MVRVSNFIVFALTAAIVLGLNFYIIDLIFVEANEKKVPKRLTFVSVASILEIFLVVLSQYTGMYYYFDEDNVYHRGPLFLLCYIIPVVCPLIQYSVIRWYRNSISRLVYFSITAYIFVPIIAGIIQIFAYGISIVNMAMVLVSITMYVSIYLDINKTVVRAHKIEVGELKKDEQKMKRLFDQTTSAFVKAIENKDDYAQGHSKRVADIAREIAKKAGKDEEKCDEVYYAALLHDIGMVGIPDSIIEKHSELTEVEHKIWQRKPIISGEILSGITEYPYLKDGGLYSNERYDGSGYPEGLKGEEIPDVARIIAVADAYVSMSSNKRYREALPYIMIRQEFVEMAGIQFDPEYANIMIGIMDRENSAKEDKRTLETELLCKEYKDAVSLGICISDTVKKIFFDCEEQKINEGDYSSPSIILFDSYDKRFHNSVKSIDAYKYVEYSEIWPDGHYVSTEAQNMKMEAEQIVDEEDKGLFDKKGTERYEICAARYDDHVMLEMKNGVNKVKAIIALSDKTKEVYVGITGENCHITNIVVSDTEIKIHEGDIERISDVISYTDRIESDIPNIQIDRSRSASTAGIKLKDEIRMYFHSRSLPVANLVWHCPFIVVFYSDDGKVGGKGYCEYALIKINGEVSSDGMHSENKVYMKKKEDFHGWDKWKEKNKEGFECFVLFEKRGNKVITKTENLGIAIDNTTVIHDEHKDVYIALTGDEVAITDIRIMD